MKETPIIGIIGGTIWGNRGAESMVVTSIGRLRRVFPDSEYLIFSYSPQNDQKLITDEKIKIINATPASLVFVLFPFALVSRLLSWIHLPAILPFVAIRQLARCDVLLDVGGISFVDGREVYLPFNILTIIPAMLLKIPVIKMAQALGPFSNPINKLAASFTLPICARIFSRGDMTSENLKSLDIHNFERSADISFLYQSNFSLSIENEELSNNLMDGLSLVKIQGRRIIVISPSSVVYQKSRKDKIDYLGSLIQIVHGLDSGDTHFLFLPNSTKQTSSKPRNNDIFVLELLKHRMLISSDPNMFSRTHWITWDVNTAALRKFMRMANLVITSRFHSMVSSLSLCIPTMVIGWSHKYLETMADFGMQQYVADYVNQGENLLIMARELLQNEQRIREKLSSSLIEVQSISEKQFQYLENLLN